ncbi:hypothetical protein [Pseudalkalibacillus berkeleyi]|uniref:Uncharacterized protein n=1 Tax=Pseudalkalibacillus berkeleyi TaxID=1069813 RepID=A0ABS9H050_9BACL|nr:hypothetical protein [Pseudalkalibacillus berkeleyi]MCF6138372.1 hypothetical protein [Pseudalkalibacillus berkeleyi]
MEWTFFIVSMVVSILTTLAAVYFRLKLRHRFESRDNQVKAKELAKTALPQEIQENFKLYLRKDTRNAGSLQEFLELGNIELQGDERVWKETYLFQLDEWDKVKYEIAKMDTVLADQLIQVYRQFEILDRHAKMESPVFRVERSGFESFTENCENIIRELNSG